MTTISNYHTNTNDYNKSHSNNKSKTKHTKNKQYTDGPAPYDKDDSNDVNRGDQKKTTDKDGADKPKSGAKLYGKFAQADKDTINFSFDDPSKGKINVSLGKDNVRITVPLNSPSDKANALLPTGESVTYELSFADPESWSPQEVELLDKMTAAFDSYDFSHLTTPQRALGEQSKARIQALQDPSFWGTVQEKKAEAEENVATLNNGQQVKIKEEYFLTPVRDSKGTVRYEVFNPGDGYTTKNIQMHSNGTSVTFGKRKGDLSPIRTDENGKLKVVLQSTPITDEQIKEGAVSDAMEEYTNGAELQGIPIANITGKTVLGGVAELKNGGSSLTYLRDQGVSENVKISNTGITFSTTVPKDVIPGLVGTPGKQGQFAEDLTTVENTLKFSDIQQWSDTDVAQVNMLKSALEGINLEDLSPEQQTLIEQATVKIEALDDPSFWSSVNSQLAGQINGEIEGEPVAIREEFKLTQVVKISSRGAKTVDFFVDRGKGREKLEIQEDDTVKLGDATFPVRRDEESGDWYMITKSETATQITDRHIGQHMKVRAGQNVPTKGGSLLTDIGQSPLPTDYVYTSNSESNNSQSNSTRSNNSQSNRSQSELGR